MWEDDKPTDKGYNYSVNAQIGTLNAYLIV